MTLVNSLFVSLLVQWCAAAYAETLDEPDIQYGRFEISRTAVQLVDQSTMESMSEILDADDTITWQMYVPDSYDPNEPAGVLVYISPTAHGGMPKGWMPVFDSENLILISADQSGNATRTKKRMLLAALAPYVVSERYEIDPERVYVSGFSGGGKVASIASIQFASLFNGAIYICGAEFWSNVAPTLLSLAMSNRYVFITGRRDFNRELTRNIYAKYKRAGVANIDLITVPNMAHSTPGETHFREAILFLDQRESIQEAGN